jgi:2,3-bisphosphoglycerate-independent phosphoglycerate mutase
MTKYFEGQSTPIAFQPPEINNCLAEVLSRAGKTQMHIAETEKYAHITYFLNGLKNIPFNGEADVFIESKKNVEQNPEMSCSEIAAHVVDKLDQDTYDFIVLNFANADFLAHTGNFNATVAGIEAVDAALSGIVSKVIQKGGIIAVTADHGNAESLVNRSGGEAETKHDDSPVFFLLVGDKFRVVKDAHRSDFEKNEVNGILPDIAPTILELMGIPKPDEMNGRSLLKILGF